RFSLALASCGAGAFMYLSDSGEYSCASRSKISADATGGGNQAMALDWQICEKARLARDVRFDGRFFTGVLTTGIFCRPVCPAPPPKAENVRYFPSAAAASEAGFRPCLRCRPEAAPGSPLWLGGEAVVGRANTLIQEGFLSRHGLPALAQRLGVDERQLRRWFQSSVGAPPKAVADMQRLLFAKKLLHETGMSMTEVAMAAGFNSLRRF